jgi:serine/threonine protein kinase
MFPSLPTRMNHYTLHSLLGEGHISFVYRAAHEQTKREVALKVLRPDSPVEEARAYFENEAAILPQLHHPHIPTFHEFVPGEPPALAFECVEGKDSEAILAEVPQLSFLPVRSVLEWGIQIADALAYLHNHHPPIAFRDLKPSHIMVDRANKAWLVDFNLARILPEDKHLSQADLIGTEGFAAPEQYAGEVSPLVDIYGLGATLHTLLTGVDPRRERKFTYTPARSINPAIPKAASQAVMKALAYEPEDRFQRMSAMKKALQNAQNEL